MLSSANRSNLLGVVEPRLTSCHSFLVRDILPGNTYVVQVLIYLFYTSAAGQNPVSSCSAEAPLFLTDSHVHANRSSSSLNKQALLSPGS